MTKFYQKNLPICAFILGVSTNTTLRAQPTHDVPIHAKPQLVAPRVKKPLPTLEYPKDVEPTLHVTIKVHLVIDREGMIEHSYIASQTPEDAPAQFAKYADQFVHALKFEPATQDNKPIRSQLDYSVHFEPKPHSPKELTSPIEVHLPLPTLKTKPNEKAAHHDVPVTPVMPSTKSSALSTNHITVQGRTSAPVHGASDLKINVGELREVPRKNATDLLKIAPGILLTNDGGEGHAEQIFLRGFDAREGQDIEFSVGGVPINDSGNIHGGGHADLHFVIPELVQSLRVLEGPFAPQQGNYAVAGSADYQLGLTQRGLTAKYSRGSFNTDRLLLLWGPKSESTRTFGGAELYRTDGFGQNRDARRGTAMAQYEGEVGQKGMYHITATAYAIDYRSAGVIREDDYQAGRIGFYDTYSRGPITQGGDASRYSIAADYETHTGELTFRQLAFLIHRGMRIRENFTGFLQDEQTPFQTLHSQRGDMIDRNFDAWVFGGRGHGRWTTQIKGLSQSIEVGYFARVDLAQSTQHRLEEATGIPYRRETDLSSKLGDIGLYADANVHLLKWLSLRGGVRADTFMFNVLDQCAAQDVSRPSRSPGDGSCFDQKRLGDYREPSQRASTSSTALLPRASLMIGPFQHFTLSVSYGQGVRSIDPQYITQDLLTPFASIAAYEGGVVYNNSIGKTHVSARSIFFQTHVDRDLIFSQTQGRNVLSNGTTRTGWVGSARVTGEFFDEAANLTLVRSQFDDTKLLIPYVPDVVLRSETAFFGYLPFRIDGKKVRATASTGLTFVGRRPLPQGERSNTIFTLDLSATLRWSLFEVGFSALNLIDSQYRLSEFNYTSNFGRSNVAPTLIPARHFTAGAPRTLMVTFGLNFGGES